MERPNKRCWTCEYHDITDNREPCKSCGFDFNNYKENSAHKTLSDDAEQYSPWEPEDLPPSVKGNPNDLPKFEKWKPKEGEWIYCDSIQFLRKCEEAESLCDKCRPAVLSDFAIEIPDKGKIWIVEVKKEPLVLRIEQLYNNTWSCQIFTYWWELWLLQGAIAHYNITVMDEATFKKLSEADNV